MTLTREQELALVEALDNSEPTVSMPDNVPLCCLDSFLCLSDEYPIKWGLSESGRIVAQLINERDEWKELCGIERLAFEKAERRWRRAEGYPVDETIND